MKIGNKTTSRKQDDNLLEVLDHIGYETKQLEKVVNIIYQNFNKATDFILDTLWDEGWSSIDTYELWLIKDWIADYSDIDIMKKAS